LVMFMCSCDVILQLSTSVSLVNLRQNWIHWIRESAFGFAHRMDGFTKFNSNPDSDSANQICCKLLYVGPG